MTYEPQRSSERVEIRIPVEVGGFDCMGQQFFDRTQTVIVSRYGAKIGLERMVVPEQEVSIRCIASGLETDARVLGQLEKVGDTHYYIVKFLDEKADIWGISFPSPADAAGAISCVLLDCNGCKSREVVYLDQFELELLETNGHLSRDCKRCRDATLWSKSHGEAPQLEHVGPAPAATGKDRRREPRKEMRIKACVRSSRFGQDVVMTRTTSRHGLSFTSSWEYVPGEAIEISVPYTSGGGNIFLAGKIVRLQLLSDEGTRLYGVGFTGRD